MAKNNTTVDRIQAVWNKLGGEEGVDRFLRGEFTVVEVVKTLLRLVKEIATAAIPAKLTTDCFTDTSRYYYRDSNLDNWLHENQPTQEAGAFAVYRTTRVATFKEMAEDLLQTTGTVAELVALIKERKLTTTLSVIESLIEWQEAGEDVGLNTDGYANFFFVDDKDRGVSVVLVRRNGGQWHVLVIQLGDGNGWRADSCLFARN